MSQSGRRMRDVLRYKEAYQCFSHCLKMDTNNVDALNAVARNAINFGRIAEAKQCYRKVLGTDSMNFYANYQWRVSIISWEIMVERRNTIIYLLPSKVKILLS